MDQHMNERKAFWHALMTVGLAVLLMTSILLFLAESYSQLAELWPVMAVIFLVTGLIMLPFVYRRYMTGPRPPLTPRQHRARAIWQAVYVIAYLALCMLPGEKRITRYTWMLVGLWLSSALNHLRLAYKKEEMHP